MAETRHIGAPIARLELVRDSDQAGDRPYIVEIYAPYATETGEWVCPVGEGWRTARISRIRGEDSFQAVCLGIRFLLTGAQDLGLGLPEGGAFPSNAYQPMA